MSGGNSAIALVCRILEKSETKIGIWSSGVKG
jgi:hypothetical protein